MKTILTTLAIAISCYVSAQTIAFNSGNKELDADLNKMNVEAKMDLGKFKTNISINYGVPVKKVDEVLSLKIEPAEAFLIFEIGNLVNKPTDEVVKAYKANKGKGWGVIAKEMGIKPGSAEFHALKNKSKGKGKDKEGKGKGKDKGEKGNGGGKGKGNGKGKNK